jgi:glycosyltransferase involved in cell wall biosynthesis
MTPTRIPTLYPVPLDGPGGPVQSCHKIARAMSVIGIQTPLFLVRKRLDISPLETICALPAWTVRLPRARTIAFGKKRIERIYFSQTRPNELCVLWPGVSVALVQALKDRGNPVVLEAINTPMRHARSILDAAYARLDIKSQHLITPARIAHEEAVYALADAIFCPSPVVEEAVQASPFGGKILSTSRGVQDTGRALPDRHAGSTDDPIVCLFVGTANVRKGMDRLIELWPSLPDRLHLRIVGKIEPLIAQRYAQALAHPRIKTIGFTKDVTSQYDAADIFVFPTREEGDPKVTYEAASAGLPLVVSRVGGGRFHAQTGACILIDPEDPDGIAQVLIDLADNPARRLSLGQAAKASVKNYDWISIARQRLSDLQNAFPDHVPATKLP